MDVTFHLLSDKDVEELVKFLTTNRFPFHSITAPSEELVRRLLVEGRFDGDGVQTYWTFGDNQRLGLVILDGLEGDSPTFDLRLVEEFRGRGNGVHVLRELTRKVFSEQPQARRFSGRTREDSIAMRKTFLRCGFLKEAHFREDWPLDNGGRRTTVIYSILRSDWEQGRISRFQWEELEP